MLKSPKLSQPVLFSVLVLLSLDTSSCNECKETFLEGKKKLDASRRVAT